MTQHVPLILVIDDSDTIRHAIASCLEISGFETINAENGIKGFGLAVDRKPDLILLDITMPGFSGYDVKKLIDNNPQIAGTPVIFVTAHAERENKLEGFEAGVDDYITKPFDFNELKARVEAVLKRSDPHART